MRMNWLRQGQSEGEGQRRCISGNSPGCKATVSAMDAATNKENLARECSGHAHAPPPLPTLHPAQPTRLQPNPRPQMKAVRPGPAFCRRS